MGWKRKVSVSGSFVSDPMDCSPTGLLCPLDFPGKNSGVGSHSLLQGIFPTQGLNSGLLHCRPILYYLSYQGSLWASLCVPNVHTATMDYIVLANWSQLENEYVVRGSATVLCPYVDLKPFVLSEKYYFCPHSTRSTLRSILPRCQLAGVSHALLSSGRIYWGRKQHVLLCLPLTCMWITWASF